MKHTAIPLITWNEVMFLLSRLSHLWEEQLALGRKKSGNRESSTFYSSGIKVADESCLKNESLTVNGITHELMVTLVDGFSPMILHKIVGSP